MRNQENIYVLDAPGIIEILRNLPLVKTTDGGTTRPSDCYFKTRKLADLLGDRPDLWVDTSSLPQALHFPLKMFLARLGLLSRPSLKHILDRIVSIVKESPSDERRGTIGTLLHVVHEIFEDENVFAQQKSFADEIQRLRVAQWLPASMNGKPKTDRWYAPHEVYQPFRAAGFDTQVPILSVRQISSRPLTGGFLDLLRMPAEPDTNVIVTHLIYCSEHSVSPNETVYQILNERVRRKDNLVSIQRLSRVPCVYSTAQKRFFSVDRIFWSKPHVPQYCFQAPNQMHSYKELFDFLGVKEEPDAGVYAGILRDIAREFGQGESVSSDIRLIHEFA